MVFPASRSSFPPGLVIKAKDYSTFTVYCLLSWKDVTNARPGHSWKETNHASLTTCREKIPSARGSETFCSLLSLYMDLHLSSVYRKRTENMIDMWFNRGSTDSFESRHVSSFVVRFNVCILHTHMYMCQCYIFVYIIPDSSQQWESFHKPFTPTAFTSFFYSFFFFYFFYFCTHAGILTWIGGIPFVDNVDEPSNFLSVVLMEERKISVSPFFPSCFSTFFNFRLYHRGIFILRHRFSFYHFSGLKTCSNAASFLNRFSFYTHAVCHQTFAIAASIHYFYTKWWDSRARGSNRFILYEAITFLSDCLILRNLYTSLA